MAKAYAKAPINSAVKGTSALYVELVCQVNTLVALRSAVLNGADRVRLNHKWNGAAFAFSNRGERHLLEKGLRRAHDARCKVSLDIRTTECTASWKEIRAALDVAVACGIDSVTSDDPTLLLYAVSTYENLKLHYAPPYKAMHAEGARCVRRYTGVSRIVLPPGLSFSQVQRIATSASIDAEVLCTHHLFATPARPTKQPDCADPAIPQVENQTIPLRACRIGLDQDTSVGCFGDALDAGNDYCFTTDGNHTGGMLYRLPDLAASRIRALQIAADDNATACLAGMVRVWREAIDTCLCDPAGYEVRPSWVAELDRLQPGLESQ